jgi:hypothetical protein
LQPAGLRLRKHVQFDKDGLESQAIQYASEDGESRVLRVFVSAALLLLLSACQMTRDREKDSQTEFDQAVRQQHKNLAAICEKITSEVQRQHCMGE